MELPDKLAKLGRTLDTCPRHLHESRRFYEGQACGYIEALRDLEVISADEALSWKEHLLSREPVPQPAQPIPSSPKDTVASKAERDLSFNPHEFRTKEEALAVSRQFGRQTMTVLPVGSPAKYFLLVVPGEKISETYTRPPMCVVRRGSKKRGYTYHMRYVPTSLWKGA